MSKFDWFRALRDEWTRQSADRRAAPGRDGYVAPSMVERRAVQYEYSGDNPSPLLHDRIAHRHRLEEIQRGAEIAAAQRKAEIARQEHKGADRLYDLAAARRDSELEKFASDFRKAAAEPAVPFPDAPVPDGYRLNTARDVAVATEVFWNEDMSAAPRGVKLQLLSIGGVAQYDVYRGESFWQGWAPVPRRRSPM